MGILAILRGWIFGGTPPPIFTIPHGHRSVVLTPRFRGCSLTAANRIASITPLRRSAE